MRIAEMDDTHLLNTIRLLLRKAKSGLTVRYGGSGPCAEDMWYDEDTIFGREALEMLHFDAYTKEAARRGLSDSDRMECAKR